MRPRRDEVVVIVKKMKRGRNDSGGESVEKASALTLLGGLIFPLPRPDIMFSLPLYQTLPLEEMSSTKTK
jgi:hypothetical protein